MKIEMLGGIYGLTFTLIVSVIYIWIQLVERGYLHPELTEDLRSDKVE